ncbi:MAG: lipoyl(octanoyl) transferase LipB [Saprospiraceae bacterium]|nr:lipoyl(octanoyl) transferase LipB [Saprospiraceae bacterium]
MITTPQVNFQDLGLMRYQQAWDYQTALHRQMVDCKLANRQLQPGDYPQSNYLLFVEHPPVYTLGKSGSLDHLLLSEAELSAQGIDYFPINRGGDITFHGPGQLVGYPILDLELFFTDVHRYVRNLEEVMIRVVGAYGIKAFRIKDYTGVWVERPHEAARYGKICAIGVHLSRWVTLHGWAFNVNTPLDYFYNIVPCGITDPDKTVTSLSKEFGQEVDFEGLKKEVKRQFAEVFECELI